MKLTYLKRIIERTAPAPPPIRVAVPNTPYNCSIMVELAFKSTIIELLKLDSDRVGSTTEAVFDAEFINSLELTPKAAVRLM